MSPTNKLYTNERNAMFMAAYIKVNLKVLLGNHELRVQVNCWHDKNSVSTENVLYAVRSFKVTCKTIETFDALWFYNVTRTSKRVLKFI